MLVDLKHQRPDQHPGAGTVAAAGQGQKILGLDIPVDDNQARAGNGHVGAVIQGLDQPVESSSTAPGQADQAGFASGHIAAAGSVGLDKALGGLGHRRAEIRVHHPGSLDGAAPGNVVPVFVNTSAAHDKGIVSTHFHPGRGAGP